MIINIKFLKNFGSKYIKKIYIVVQLLIIFLFIKRKKDLK